MVTISPFDAKVDAPISSAGKFGAHSLVQVSAALYTHTCLGAPPDPPPPLSHLKARVWCLQRQKIILVHSPQQCVTSISNGGCGIDTVDAMGHPGITRNRRRTYSKHPGSTGKSMLVKTWDSQGGAPPPLQTPHPLVPCPYTPYSCSSTSLGPVMCAMCCLMLFFRVHPELRIQFVQRDPRGRGPLATHGLPRVRAGAVLRDAPDRRALHCVLHLAPD